MARCPHSGACDQSDPFSPARIALNSRDLVDRGSERPELRSFIETGGERLKGIALAVALRAAAEPVRVVVSLRQVCARHFRDTFLYD